MKKKVKIIGFVGTIATIILVCLLERNLLREEYFIIFNKTGTIKHFNDKGIKDGLFEYYIGGKIYGKINYVNGLRQGWAYQYYNNGQIKDEIYYKNDIADSIESGFYENGKLNFLIRWRNNKWYGSTKNWDKDGKISAYSANDLENIFYYSEFDSLGNRVKGFGKAISHNLYSIANTQDSIVILNSKQSYNNIKDLYILAATPPNLSTKISVHINGDSSTFDKIPTNNTIIIKGAFLKSGIYKINAIGQLFNDKGKVVRSDTVNTTVIKN